MEAKLNWSREIFNSLAESLAEATDEDSICRDLLENVALLLPYLLQKFDVLSTKINSKKPKTRNSGPSDLETKTYGAIHKGLRYIANQEARAVAFLINLDILEGVVVDKRGSSATPNFIPELVFRFLLGDGLPGEEGTSTQKIGDKQQEVILWKNSMTAILATFTGDYSQHVGWSTQHEHPEPETGTAGSTEFNFLSAIDYLDAGHVEEGGKDECLVFLDSVKKLKGKGKQLLSRFKNPSLLARLSEMASTSSSSNLRPPSTRLSDISSLTSRECLFRISKTFPQQPPVVPLLLTGRSGRARMDKGSRTMVEETRARTATATNKRKSDQGLGSEGTTGSKARDVRSRTDGSSGQQLDHDTSKTAATSSSGSSGLKIKLKIPPGLFQLEPEAKYKGEKGKRKETPESEDEPQ